MRCSAPTCVPMSCRTLSQGSPKLQPIGPPAPDAHLPLGRSTSTRICTPAPVRPSHNQPSLTTQLPRRYRGIAYLIRWHSKSSLSPLISGLQVAAPFFEACHVSHLAQVLHPCLSPTAPSPSARYPHTARCAMDAHHSGTPTPRNGFACQPRSCILNPAFRATSASWSATASLPVAILSAQYASRHHHVPCLCLELHLTARSCSCSCLPPCLNTDDKLRGSAARGSKLCDSS